MKMNIIAVARQVQREYLQACLVDAALHPQQHFLVSVSATTKADRGVFGHYGSPGKCR